MLDWPDGEFLAFGNDGTHTVSLSNTRNICCRIFWSRRRHSVGLFDWLRNDGSEVVNFIRSSSGSFSISR